MFDNVKQTHGFVKKYKQIAVTILVLIRNCHWNCSYVASASEPQYLELITVLDYLKQPPSRPK